MAAEKRNPAEEEAPGLLESTDSTAFLLWLLITVSAGIIMAQDSWLGLQQPRLSTVDATAAFTKIMVIHALWLVVTVGFVAFTWVVRPTSAWKIHLVLGAITVLWTIGVLVWAFSDVERLQVSTWECESAPTEPMVTERFLASCSLADRNTTIRLGGDIFLWSADNEHYWRWIVPGVGLTTLQTRWPSQASAMYLATEEPDAELISGSLDSVPGGNWSAQFDPNASRQLRIYFVIAGPIVPLEPATPETIGFMPDPMEHLYHERFKYTG